MESPATQNMTERQDTDIRNMRAGPLTELAAFESMLTGALQVLPSKVTTFPSPPSTAAQKLLAGQDTTGQEIPPSPMLRPFGSALTGALQVRASAKSRLSQGADGPGRWRMVYSRRCH